MGSKGPTGVSRTRVLSAMNKTAAGSTNNSAGVGVNHSINTTMMMKASSKPAMDYLNMTSLKSSIKSDPNTAMVVRQGANSISSECLQA